MKGLTITYGNGPLAHTVADAKALLAQTKKFKKLPVHAGATWTSRGLQSSPASSFLVSQAQQWAQPGGTKAVLLALGPLTNVAAAIRQDQTFCDNIEAIFLPNPEGLNFIVHAEATRVVLDSDCVKVAMHHSFAEQVAFDLSVIDQMGQRCAGANALKAPVVCRLLPHLSAMAEWHTLPVAPFSTLARIVQPVSAPPRPASLPAPPRMVQDQPFFLPGDLLPVLLLMDNTHFNNLWEYQAELSPSGHRVSLRPLDSDEKGHFSHGGVLLMPVAFNSTVKASLKVLVDALFVVKGTGAETPLLPGFSSKWESLWPAVLADVGGCQAWLALIVLAIPLCSAIGLLACATCGEYRRERQARADEQTPRTHKAAASATKKKRK